MRSYRVLTTVIGRKLAVVPQFLQTKPAVIFMPLLELMLAANAPPLASEDLFRVIAGPHRGA
jgi:hypothetical protein